MSGYNPVSPSILATFIPSLEGQGPIGSAARILVKLHQAIFNVLPKDFSTRRREEDMHRKSIKVVDLLQHSAEMGNNDALYTLARISLVRLCQSRTSRKTNQQVVSSD